MGAPSKRDKLLWFLFPFLSASSSSAAIPACQDGLEKKTLIFKIRFLPLSKFNEWTVVVVMLFISQQQQQLLQSIIITNSHSSISYSRSSTIGRTQYKSWNLLGHEGCPPKSNYLPPSIEERITTVVIQSFIISFRGERQNSGCCNLLLSPSHP